MHISINAIPILNFGHSWLNINKIYKLQSSILSYIEAFFQKYLSEGNSVYIYRYTYKWNERTTVL